MRYTSDENRRYAFRDWLRSELARLDFYQRRGDRYLVSEFARYAQQKGARVEEVSLGRYLREDNPVLPTPESCRELARALDRHPAEALLEAGYLTPEDFYYMPGPEVGPETLEQQREEIARASYLPEAIRQQMQAALDRQLQMLQLPIQPQAETDVEAPTAQTEERARPIEQEETDILDQPQQASGAPKAKGVGGLAGTNGVNGGPRRSGPSF